MNPWRLPAKRWSILQHMLLASLLVLGVAAASWIWGQVSRNALSASRAELLELRSQQKSVQRASTSPSSTSLAQTLPGARQSEDIVREIGRSAQALGVKVVSLSIEPRAATATEFGRVQFSLVVSAQYRAVKSWIAELLSRYPRLGVASMSMQNSANDPSQLDISMIMVLITKD